MTAVLRYLLPIAVISFAVDRLSKWWIVDHLNLRELGYLDAFPPYLNLIMAWNTGINFGIPLGGPAVLIGLSVVISAGLFVWVWRRGEAGLAAGCGLIVGGALGNAWDRAFYPEQAVADFINNSLPFWQNPFSYNVADVAIVLGALWVAVKA
ncbi:MAG: signal peptidase II [Pseudomonadota bacterium]